MGLELAKAYVSVHADSAGFDNDMKGIQGKVAAGVGRLNGLVGPAIAAVIGGAGISGMISIAADAVNESQRAQESYARLAAVLRATGGAAGFTTDQLSAYASELQNSSTVGDDEIMESMAILGTFKSVSGDVFKRATAAALDLSAAGFGSVSGATQQLAKALEDPVRGLGALRRVGVSFTAEQEKQIKNYVATNQLAQAQAIILGAVEGQVQGTAAALANTDSGQLKQLENTLGDIKEELGAAVMPLFIKFKELQVTVMRSIVDVVKWIRVLADNSGVTWDLLVTQAKLSVSQIFDFFKNLWEYIPTLFSASVSSMTVVLNGWVSLVANGLKEVLNIFKTAYTAIRDFWLNLFTGGGLSASFDKAVATIGAQVQKSMTKQLKDATNIGKSAAEEFANKTKDVDLFALGDQSKALQLKRDALAAQLAAARAAMDTPQTPETPNTNLKPMNVPMAVAGVLPQIEAGRTGFADLGKKVQDAVFKEQDGNQKKMISLMEAGNKIQEEQLKAIKDSKPAVVEAGLA